MLHMQYFTITTHNKVAEILQRSKIYRKYCRQFFIILSEEESRLYHLT